MLSKIFVVPMLGDRRATLILFLIFCLVLVSLPNITAVKATEDYWTTKVPLPVARAGFKAAAVNEKIYVMKLNITYEYNLYSWSTKTSMPTPRGDFGIAAYQNRVYCIGGRTNSGPSATNEVYDPDSDSWESKAALLTPRHGLDANVVNGKIYLISGLVPDNRWPDANTPIYTTFKLTDVTEVYDPATDTWTTKASIPNAVCYYASGVVGNKIYVVSENLTQIYDPETDSWSFGAPPLYPVDMAGGAATTGDMAPERIYVIGGREGGLEVPYTQVYNPMDDSWSLGASMLTPRYDFAVAVVNDQIYTMGGLTGAFVVTEQKNQNEQYTPIGYIPEFPSWTPLLIMLIGVLVVTVIYKQKLHKQNRRRDDQ
jgi:hypothetical protein